MSVAMYFAVRGLKISEFFALPLLEKVAYYEAARREIDVEKQKMTMLLTALGMKKSV